MTNQYQVQFRGSEEWRTVSAESAMGAARKCLRHYNSTVTRVKCTAPGVFAGTNGRIGANKRGATVVVREVA